MKGLVVAICCLLLLTGIGAPPAPVQPPKYTEQSPLAVKLMNNGEAPGDVKAARKREDDKSKFDRHIANYNVWLTVGLVVVGLLQAAAIIYTALVTDKSAKAAQSSAAAVVSQLRAYLHALIAQPPLIGPDRVLRVVVGIKNTGQTPAFNALIVSNIGIVSWPPPRPREQIFVDNQAAQRVHITIPPGETSHNIPEMPDVSAEEEAGLRAAALRIVVWGRVDYQDSFNNHRLTHYAFSIAWEGEGFGAPFYEPVGNDAT